MKRIFNRKTIGSLLIAIFVSVPYVIAFIFALNYLDYDDPIKWVFIGLVILGLSCFIFLPNPKSKKEIRQENEYKDKIVKELKDFTEYIKNQKEKEEIDND